MKKGLRFLAIIAVALVLSSTLILLEITNTKAQIDDFTYFIPYPADNVDDLYDLGNNSVGPGNDVNMIISMALARDGMIIYYDHWEDGYETNITTPAQVCTEVWGDGDEINGKPPNYAPGDDTLGQIKPVVLENEIALPTNPVSLSGPCNAANGYNYDGGDKLTAVGGNIAISVAAWVTPEAEELYAGSWELYPTARWGTDFIIPIGEDLSFAPPRRRGFRYTKVNIQAVEDNTLVDLDLDADGVFEAQIRLNQGEQFTQPLTDGLTVESGTILSPTLSGARIRSNHKVQTHLFTSRPQVNYEARAYSILPRDVWRNDYVAPRGEGSDFWLHNPNGSPLDVEIRDNTGGVFTLTIPADTTLPYPEQPPSPNVISSTTTGLRFTAPDGRAFYALAAVDDNQDQDWGYGLLPAADLTTQKIVGWAPGDSSTPDPLSNRSQLYITALNPTTVTVEFNNGPGSTISRSFFITPLTQIAISDTDDFDLTGAYLYSEDDEPFVAVWGQDQDAPRESPSIDVGTAIVPLPAITSQKLVDLAIDADNSGTYTWNDVITYTVLIINNARTKYNPINVTDNLESSLIYINDSTELVRSTAPTSPIPDDCGGTTCFPLDEGGILIPGGLEVLEVVSVTFRAQISAGVSSVQNAAVTGGITSTSSVTSSSTVEISVLTPAYELDKRVISPTTGIVERGGEVIYGITITSTGNMSITTLPLIDTFDSTQLEVVSVVTATPDAINPGVTSWNNLASNDLFGPFDPGETIHITVTSRVIDTSNTPGFVTITNTATISGAEGFNGSSIPPQSDSTPIMVPPSGNYIFDKRVISPPGPDFLTQAGEVVTFGLTITSTGNLTIAELSLRDTYNPDHLIFQFSDPAPNPDPPAAASTIIWDQLGPIGLAETKRLTVTYLVADPFPDGVTSTTNTASTYDVTDEGGNPLPPFTDTGTVIITVPPTDPPGGGGGDDGSGGGGGDDGSGGGGGDDDDDDDGGGGGDDTSSTDTGTGPPPTEDTPPTTSTGEEIGGVSLLPETGYRNSTNAAGLLLLTITLGVIGIIVVRFRPKN